MIRVVTSLGRVAIAAVCLLLAVQIVPSAALACEGAAAESENIFSNTEAGSIGIKVEPPPERCKGTVKLKDVSTIKHNPIILNTEVGIECKIVKEGCKGFEFKTKGDFCESILLPELGTEKNPRYKQNYTFEEKPLEFINQV
jgi:hypothetical protein